MSFRIPCPQCGTRSAYEFRFGGEVLTRPRTDADADAWYRYSFARKNTMGIQTEWWYHRLGCRQWLQVVRDTKENRVLATSFIEKKEREDCA